MAEKADHVPQRVIHVLLIEDTEIDRAGIIQMVEGLIDPSFSFTFASTLSEGLALLEKEKSDIVLVDLGLPDSQGLSTFLQVRDKAPQVPIVILSGYDDDGLSLRAVREGAQDYIVKKDITKGSFIRTIRYAIERHRLSRKLESVTNELITANRRLESLVLIDPMTGLLNHRGIQQALSREIQWSWREHGNLLALLINLDDFKQINDTFGYAVGDVVLKETARKIKASLRTTDYVARIGGDEFMILLPKTDPDEGARIAERLRLAISESPITLSSNKEVKVTASIGLIAVDEDTPSIDELLAHSHPILTASKQTGKNRITCQPAAAALRKNGESLGGDIFDVLRNGQYFRSVKQPLFRLADEQMVGYEFLSRLTLPGFENPDVFFRACLEANILTLVDHKCLKICLQSASTLPTDLQKHFNLFPSTMLDIPVEHLIESFPRGHERSQYCVEVSEQQIIGNPSYLIDSVEALKRAGILIAIDDVGFGRTCLESLILLEPNIIKIDKRCVLGISQDIIRVRHMQRMLKLAQSLGAKVVAEGIEFQEDLKVLQRMGVEFGQGFYWGKPA